MFPADRNAVVGIKPTVGLTSTLGVIPEAPTMDTVGTFGRLIEDATIVLDIITIRSLKYIPRGDASKPGLEQEVNAPLYTERLAKRDALKGAIFGMPMKMV